MKKVIGIFIMLCSLLLSADVSDVASALSTVATNTSNITSNTTAKIIADNQAQKVLNEVGTYYKNSLDLALKHDIHSIAFPAISTGVYHYPLEEATKIAISTVKTWLDMHKDYKLDIIFSCFDEKTYNMYQRYLEA